MKNYELSADEVVLYKGNTTLKDKKGMTELVLTNLNIVFITTHKKLFSKEDVVVDSYPVNDIKIYKGIPQLVTKGNVVEVYLLSCEKEVCFNSKCELIKFVNAVNDLLTQKTLSERCAEKVKKTIGLVNDTLGIDSVNAVSNIVKDGFVGTTASLLNKGISSVSKIFKKKK